MAWRSDWFDPGGGSVLWRQASLSSGLDAGDWAARLSSVVILALCAGLALTGHVLYAVIGATVGLLTALAAFAPASHRP
jgi:hypothetical protein